MVDYSYTILLRLRLVGGIRGSYYSFYLEKNHYCAVVPNFALLGNPFNFFDELIFTILISNQSWVLKARSCSNFHSNYYYHHLLFHLIVYPRCPLISVEIYYSESILRLEKPSNFRTVTFPRFHSANIY